MEGEKADFLVRKSPIWKFFGSIRYRKYANFLGVLTGKPQIWKFLWLIRKSQVREFLHFYKILHSSVSKVVLLTNVLLCTNWKLSIRCYICKEKKYVFAESQITEQIGSADRKSAKCHICRRPANLTNYSTLQICGYIFAELLCVPPTFSICSLYKHFCPAWSR